MSNNVEGVRINKYLSQAGVCSRRAADEHIANGEVLIDDVVAESGMKVMPGQKVYFKGKLINSEDEFILIAFNKPVGIVCTAEKREKDNIIDYINYPKRIFPIGRLDKNSQGLILLTNDGDIFNKIIRGSNEHEKEYIVKVNKPITDEFIEQMSKGVYIEDLDKTTRPCKITKVNDRSFKIILTQGLNRQIRRMCKVFGYRVTYLKRVRIMNIQLRDLKVGEYRNVTSSELKLLKSKISKSTNGPRRV
ncbi:pseudouridine synthase [Lachnobacterium bovis]|uniref:Pseudouridine synthase n=1 Tax=Lachnobacterium bovis TaxID=140626 RepID=A0A1H9PT59_9FIRM|nr:pseudouridine synthase [Lachnobacterium bovis]SER51486.1 23S rRNA pseudouridine2604 synthase [Lachnobacterium bovis]